MYRQYVKSNDSEGSDKIVGVGTRNIERSEGGGDSGVLVTTEPIPDGVGLIKVKLVLRGIDHGEIRIR